ncbi:unknown [Clostridium sp. CAG:352]|uniref:hypothetical protein n=1 Tax=Pseudoruminococcus massiliensis TaxID=2086583 RepID=UPI00033DAF9B|nr:unknown [Clostridium sp. CAG:352]SCI87176.1 Uncharacterised protein [uncultured Ruminococcus sp.]
MENMKKTKKFLLDEKSTNEETLDKEFLEEESLDEEESEEETLEERTNTVKTWIVLIILSIVGICFMINFFNTCCTGEKTYHEKECDWCGRFEECKMYTVSYVNGYNNNGTFKVDYDFMWFSDDCIYKAKNSGKWLKID